MSVKIYTTGCPRCKILEKKLKDQGVLYEEITDVDKMISLGIDSVPVMVYNGVRYDFVEAIQLINMWEEGK